MSDDLTILIVGGYGTFGGRLVELLEQDARLNVIVAGRSRQRADAFCQARRHATARLVPSAFDRTGDVRAQLAGLRPDLLVDASGPFQGYGERPYHLVEACIAEGSDYIDLADGSDFVAGIGAVDDAARAAGRYALSGASSFPVLTAAVTRRLSADLSRIDTIHAGVAPSPYAGVGTNVIRAVAGYAGQRVTLKRAGDAVIGYPFTEQIRFTIAPPGRVPLRNTLFSLVDVPDLRALAALWPDAKTIWMGAGPMPEAPHHVLIALAWLVRLRLLPSLLPLATVMHAATNRLRWGEHRGGMFVKVTGEHVSGAPIERSWHLLAEGDAGPFIPAMAAAALVRRILDGHRPASGARAALSDLEIGDYENLFRQRAIHTGITETPPIRIASLYERILGPAWNALQCEIRVMHGLSGSTSAAGRASVDRGRSVLARLIALIVGFPKEETDTSVSVRFDVAHQTEKWTRVFGRTRFSSVQFAGIGRSAELLCERFGPLVFAMALVVEDARLTLVLRRWSAFGVPLPLWLGPRSTAYESAADGRFRFHVEISHPLCGLIVRYRGWLSPPSA